MDGLVSLGRRCAAPRAFPRVTRRQKSTTDWEIWKGLLTAIDKDIDSVTYSEHLPGATSELTLFILREAGQREILVSATLTGQKRSMIWENPNR